MAIYSLNVGFVSRSEGRSSVGFGAYIAGEKAHDERTGTSFDFSHKDEVIVARVLTPEGAPAWMSDREKLWNAVEKFEDNIASLRFQGGEKSQIAKEKFLNSAQTSQTIMGAIPLELTKDQSEVCVEEFLKTRFVSRGLIVDYAIHWEEGNPHFHGMVTRRALEDGVFSQRKDREIVSKVEHNQTRKVWEQVVNKHLEKAGHEVRIDARSNADRGLLFEAQEHEGWHAQRLADRGEYSRIVSENEAVRQRNIEIMVEKPEALIHELSLKRTTFTRRHLEEEIIRRVGGDERLFAILKARVEGVSIDAQLILKQANTNGVYDASELKKIASQLTDRLLKDEKLTHFAGENFNREKIYSSQEHRIREEEIVSFADELASRERNVETKFIEKAIERREGELGRPLSDEQRQAVYHLCSGSDIRVLNGKAGTGKTTLLKAVAEAYKAQGFEVMGTSFQGKAVEIMQKEIGISCRTLDSLHYHWQKHAEQKDLLESGKLWGRPYLYAHQKMKGLEKHFFTGKNVIIVDEANMIGNKLWEPFLKEVASKGAKVLVVEDQAQIKSREPGDVGRLLADRYGYAETNTVVRQRVAWQGECSQLLNEHQVLDGLKPYEERGHFRWFKSDEAAQAKLAKDFVKNPTNDSRIALAYTNVEVRALNSKIREALKSQGCLRGTFHIAGQEYAVGDKIRFTQNDNHGKDVQNQATSLKEHFFSDKLVGVKNGSFGVIEAFEKGKLSVRLEDNRQVYFDPQKYSSITHGYAMGIHKSEGSTFDRTYILPSRHLEPSTTLVMATRHRDNTQFYISHEKFTDFKDLVETCSKGQVQANLQDYAFSEAAQPYVDRVRQYKDLMIEAVTLREEMDGSLKPREPLYKHSSYAAYQLCFAQKKEVARDILAQWDAHKPYTRLAGIRKDVLEVETGQRQRLFSQVEQQAQLNVQEYMGIARETRTLWKTIQETHPGVLAKQHALYEEYQTQREKRDGLAFDFMKAPKLHQQFFRDQAGEDKVYWKGVQAHSLAYQKAQSENEYLKNLNPEDRAAYLKVKDYQETRNMAAALYHQVKSQEQNAIQINDPELLSRFKEAQLKRDATALDVVNQRKDMDPYFERLNIREEALLGQATKAQLRGLATDYVNQKGSFLRAEYAAQLKESLTEKSSFQVVKECGVDLNRLKFDVAFGQAIAERKIPLTQDPEQVYKPLQNYLTTSQESAKLWKMVQAGDQTRQQEYRQVLEARNQNAEIVYSSKAAMGILSVLHPSLVERVEKQASNLSLVKKEVPPLEKGRLSVDQVLHESKHQYPSITRSLLGQENAHMSTATTLRYGKKGSLVMNVEGSKAGLWHDFSTGEGGNIFSLIQREKGCSFKESVELLGGQLGVRPDLSFESRQSVVREETRQDSDAEKIAKLAAVQSLYQKAVSVRGTAAEPYLKNVRKISTSLIYNSLGDDIRAIPKGTTFLYNGSQKTLNHSCLAAFGRDKDGILLSVQLTRLNEDGTRATLQNGEKIVKTKYGLGKDAFVTIQSNPKSQTVIIAEGVETALSLKQAGIEATIVAAQGIHNIKNYQGPEKHIVLATDNDDHNPKSGTHKVIAQAQEHFQNQGKDVTVIKPVTPGHDFNDVLKEKGASGVREHLYPIQASQAAHKIEGLKEQLKASLTADQKENLAYDLKYEMKGLRHEPEILSYIKTSNPDLGREIESVISKDRSRGR